jgi:hypothetical protein
VTGIATKGGRFRPDGSSNIIMDNLGMKQKENGCKGGSEKRSEIRKDWSEIRKDWNENVGTSKEEDYDVFTNFFVCLLCKFRYWLQLLPVMVHAKWSVESFTSNCFQWKVGE